MEPHPPRVLIKGQDHSPQGEVPRRFRHDFEIQIGSSHVDEQR